MRYIRLLLVILVLSPVLVHHAMAQVEFTDTEFDIATDWSDLVFYTLPESAQGADWSAMQVASGGNPDAYGETTITRATVPDGDVVTWAAMINDTLVWDPGHPDFRRIFRIDFNIDVRRAPATGSRVVTLAVRQGEYVWMAVARRVLFNEDGWLNKEIRNLRAEDFVRLPGSEAVVQGQPKHPDFTVDGDPVYFGIGTGMSCPATSNCAVTAPRNLDLDNLRVTVNRPLNINAGVTDAWFNQSTVGQGFFIVIFPDLGIVFLAWFTYDTERPPEDVEAILGDPGHRWVTAQGPFEGDTATLDVFLTEGGVFDAAEPEAVTNQDPIGTITIVWGDCENAWLTYDIDPPGVSGEFPLQRIALDNVPLCEALDDQ